MANAVIGQLNDQVFTTFVPADFGAGSNTFVAYSQRVDKSLGRSITGFVASVNVGAAADIGAGSQLAVMALRGIDVTPGTVVNNLVRIDPITVFQYQESITTVCMQLSHQFTFPFQFLYGEQYAIVANILGFGVPVASIRARLTVFGYDNLEPTQRVHLR